jgi:ABC-type antimicrobial peptide transport system permease subunit
VQCTAATRTQEIGLRLALGAQRGDIFGLLIVEGLSLGLMGLAVGLVGAWWLGRAGASLLVGVTAGDPLTFAAVSLLQTTVALAACYVLARRATTVDAMAAMRVA